MAITFCYPFDLTKRLMQLNGSSSQFKYNGVTDMFFQTYKKEGIFGFYKGFGVTL